MNTKSNINRLSPRRTVLSLAMRQVRNKARTPNPTKGRGKATSVRRIKWGDNYIEISFVSSIQPMVYEVDQEILTRYTVNPKLRQIAKILAKSQIPGLRRLGYDILEEY